MKKRIITAALAGIIAVSMIAGCSSKSASDPIREHNGEAEMYAASDDVYLTANKTLDAANGFSATAEFEMEDWDAQPLNAPDPTGGNIDPTQGRLLIRTVTITAETTNYLQVAADVESKVKEFGGYIEYSSMRGTGNNRDLRSGTYTVRVPADKLDELISSVGSNCTVISSNENTSDVTLEYVDTKARIESLRVEYDQLLTLLSQAEDLDTIITLQNRLSEVRYQIESAESRVRVLENQVQYATLTLTLNEVLEEKEPEEAHVVTYGERVSNQFKEMWENTVDFFQGLLLGIIACIPGLIFIAIIVAVVLIIVFTARKKRRARRAKALALKEAEEKKASEKKTENNNEKKEDKKEEKK